MTWPPKTRCQPTCGERPRNRFTSIGSRSRMASRSFTAEVIDRPNLRHPVSKRDAQTDLAICGSHAWDQIEVNRLMVTAPPDGCSDVLIAGGGFAGFALAIAL